VGDEEEEETPGGGLLLLLLLRTWYAHSCERASFKHTDSSDSYPSHVLRISHNPPSSFEQPVASADPQLETHQPFFPSFPSSASKTTEEHRTNALVVLKGTRIDTATYMPSSAQLGEHISSYFGSNSFIDVPSSDTSGATSTRFILIVVPFKKL
jgi:hypothetical protein